MIQNSEDPLLFRAPHLVSLGGGHRAGLQWVAQTFFLMHVLEWVRPRLKGLHVSKLFAAYSARSINVASIARVGTNKRTGSN